MKKNKPISDSEIRQLVFWASVGIGMSNGGSYASTVPYVIAAWSKVVNIKPIYNAFGEGLKRQFEPNKKK